ncbi:MAG: tetratricopeptide repeat protein [Desulfovermiculus sp.]|nr:tetratricopeptide repeat protein [Desulfovermiculus sp.]
MFIALSVESGIIPIRDAMFEHRMYLPLFGPSLLFGYFVYVAGNKVQRPWLVLPAAVCILLLLGCLTHVRNQLWENPVALWTDSVQKNPENDRAWNNLGKAELEQDNLERAEEHFHQALDINPKHPRAKGNSGLYISSARRVWKALPYVREAAQALPEAQIISIIWVCCTVSWESLSRPLLIIERPFAYGPNIIRPAGIWALSWPNRANCGRHQRSWAGSWSMSLRISIC